MRVEVRVYIVLNPSGAIATIGTTSETAWARAAALLDQTQEHLENDGWRCKGGQLDFEP